MTEKEKPFTLVKSLLPHGSSSELVWVEASKSQRAHDMREFRRWLVDDIDTSEYGNVDMNAFCIEMAEVFEGCMRELGIEL